MVRSGYIVILIKSEKGLELVSSFQHPVKNMLEMFVIHPNSNSPDFILIVLRIQKE